MLQIKEETMAALPAPGMLTVLAGGVNTARNIAVISMPAQSKVSWGACMAASHFVLGAPINWQTGAACLGLGFGGTGLLINRAQAWWGIDLDETIGEAVLSALGLADYAGAAAGPIGTGLLINRAQAWWGVQLDVRVGQAVLTALGLSRFAGAVAGPIGLLAIIGQAFQK